MAAVLCEGADVRARDVAGDDGDLDWLSDYVLSFLTSPTWLLPVAQFVDERCLEFGPEEENKLEYTQCHKDFMQLIDSLLVANLLEVSVTGEQFESFCQTGLTRNATLHCVLVEQLMSVDDFLTFKAMMVRRNAALHVEAWKHVEAAGAHPAAQPPVFGDAAPALASPAGADGARVAPGAALDATASTEGEAALGSGRFGVGADPAVELGATLHRGGAADDTEGLLKAMDLAGTWSLEDEEDSYSPCNRRSLLDWEWQLYEDRLLSACVGLPTPARDDQDLHAAEQEALPALSAAAAAEGGIGGLELAAPPGGVEVPPAVDASALERGGAPGGAAADCTAAGAVGSQRRALPRLVRLEPLNHAPMLAGAWASPACTQQAARAAPSGGRPPAAAPIRPASARGAPPTGGSGAAPRAVAPGPSEAERRQRAEHLKQMREALLQKRRQERQRQLEAYQRGAGGRQPPGAGVRSGHCHQSAAGLRLAAQLAGARCCPPSAAAPAPPAPPLQSGDAAAAAVRVREALMAQLRQTLARLA